MFEPVREMTMLSVSSVAIREGENMQGTTDLCRPWKDLQKMLPVAEEHEV